LAIMQQILLVPMSSAVTIRWRLLLMVVVYPIPLPTNPSTRLALGRRDLGARSRNVDLLRHARPTGGSGLAQAHGHPIEQAKIDGGDIAFEHAFVLVELSERGQRLGDIVVGQHDLQPRGECERPAAVADPDGGHEVVSDRAEGRQLIE
jgi:hypothetical protein